MSKNTLVDVKNLSVHFPVHGGVFSKRVATVKAVDGISFSIDKKQIVGMVGESGCGKTTVGRAMINILKYISPEVEVGGSIEYHFDDGIVDFAKLKASEMRKYRSRVQMIFQDPYASLNPRMTVAQIISEPLQLHTKMNPKEQRDRVGWLLDKVGLQPEQARRFPHEFSGGQRQRIGIARALATNPDLIICDEPVSALDVSIQAQVINLMMDIQDEFDVSYLIIAHDLSVVEHISDKIAVMYLGDMAEYGDAQDVYHHPRHPYSKALLSAVPLPDPSRKNRKRIVLKGDVPTPLNKPSGCAFRTRCPIAQPSCAESKPEFKEHAKDHFVACPIVEKKALNL
ncbi:MAG: ATP-binding cassette domain-containing protein [Candidatus Marinimicrobia bacterium]|nr:ATP-binding cassette domain-containing protein [Candidatus Neomarinimicrobiota bacterium]